MDLNEFKQRFVALKDQGFVRSLRKGPTGVGYTFETLLELPENNLALPDLGTAEIKTHREGANSMITLFTFNKNAWVMPPLEAINKYGSYDRNNRKGLYYTLSLTPNSAGLFLEVTDDSLHVRHTSGEEVVTWEISTLEERFRNKFPALLFVSAHVEHRGGVEYFHFYRAQLMQGTSSHLLKNLFRTGELLVDLRLHDKGTSARNHGTGFRVYMGNLPRLFTKTEDIGDDGTR